MAPLPRNEPEKEPVNRREKQQGKSVYKYEIDDLIPFHLESLKPSILMWLEFITQSITCDILVKIYAKELHQPIEQNIEIEIIVEDKERVTKKVSSGE